VSVASGEVSEVAKKRFDQLKADALAELDLIELELDDAERDGFDAYSSTGILWTHQKRLEIKSIRGASPLSLIQLFVEDSQLKRKREQVKKDVDTLKKITRRFNE
jgi:hypothetical protein